MDYQQLKNLIKELIKLPKETEWVEFKESYFDPQRPDLLGQRISGLANSACLLNKDFGYLVFGIKDIDHSIIGTRFKPSLFKIGNEELEVWLLRMLDPKVDIRIFEFKIEERNVVVFQIPAATDRPVKFKNQAYIRIGSITKNLKDYPDKERKIWVNFGNRKFEKNIAVSNLTVDQVLQLIDYDQYFNLTKQPIPSSTDKFLEKMEQDKLVIKKPGKVYDITNLGAILFAKDIHQFDTVKRKSVRVIIYDGKNRLKRIKEQEKTEGYASGFEELINYINDKLPTNEEIVRALREEKKMYPEVAIRELVANALIHQDFNERGTGPLIEIFDDRIEITNPGEPLISIERIIDYPPKSRNEDLASFMRRVKICEEGGTGIDRALINIELFQLPAPKFEALDGFTKVTLYAYKKLSKMSKEDKVRACYQHCVLRYLSNEKMTNASLRERFGISEDNYPMASRIIRETLNAKLIKESNRRKEYVPIWA